MTFISSLNLFSFILKHWQWITNTYKNKPWFLQEMEKKMPEVGSLKLLLVNRAKPRMLQGVPPHQAPSDGICTDKLNRYWHWSLLLHLWSVEKLTCCFASGAKKNCGGFDYYWILIFSVVKSYILIFFIFLENSLLMVKSNMKFRFFFKKFDYLVILTEIFQVNKVPYQLLCYFIWQTRTEIGLSKKCRAPLFCIDSTPPPLYGPGCEFMLTRGYLYL